MVQSVPWMMCHPYKFPWRSEKMRRQPLTRALVSLGKVTLRSIVLT